MNKKLVISLCALLVLTANITAGVFSKYSSTLDTTGKVAAKTFIINTLNHENIGTTNYNDELVETDLKLAPGEYIDRYFTIQNWGGEVVSDVSMDVVISLTWATNIKPLYCGFYEVSDSSEYLADEFNEGYNFSEIDTESGLPSNTLVKTYTFHSYNGAQTMKFKVRMGWTDGSSYTDTDYINNNTYFAKYRIGVVGTQLSVDLPNPDDLAMNGFMQMLQNMNSTAYLYNWTKTFNYPGTTTKANGKLNDFTSKKNFNVTLDSNGQNFGKTHVNPELASIYGQSTSANYSSSTLVTQTGLFNTDFSYSIIRYSYNDIYSTKIYKNALWRYDVIFSYLDIDKHHNEAVEAYRINGRTGYLEKGTCDVTVNPNVSYSSSTLDSKKQYVLNRNNFTVINSSVKKLFDENTTFNVTYPV